MGEDLGEGFARRVNINECTTLSPSPSPQERVASAFTLAEVLITLVIIGVIAAITVPTLITKYQKEQTVTRLKKAYSALAQTTNRAIADNGPIETWSVIRTSDGSGPEDFFNKYLKKYLSIARYCGSETTDKCNFEYTYMNKTNKISLQPKWIRFYLQDGVFVALTTTVVGGTTNPKVEVYIDINGNQKPNKFGRDVFFFNYYILDDKNKIVGKFVPYYYNMTRNYIKNSSYFGACSKEANVDAAGFSCASLIMKDGWRIADDYPW